MGGDRAGLSGWEPATQSRRAAPLESEEVHRPTRRRDSTHARPRSGPAARQGWELPSCEGHLATMRGVPNFPGGSEAMIGQTELNRVLCFLARMCLLTWAFSCYIPTAPRLGLIVGSF